MEEETEAMLVLRDGPEWDVADHSHLIKVVNGGLAVVVVQLGALCHQLGLHEHTRGRKQSMHEVEHGHDRVAADAAPVILRALDDTLKLSDVGLHRGGRILAPTSVSKSCHSIRSQCPRRRMTTRSASLMSNLKWKPASASNTNSLSNAMCKLVTTSLRSCHPISVTGVSLMIKLCCSVSRSSFHASCVILSSSTSCSAMSTVPTACIGFMLVSSRTSSARSKCTSHESRHWSTSARSSARQDSGSYTACA